MFEVVWHFHLTWCPIAGARPLGLSASSDTPFRRTFIQSGFSAVLEQLHSCFFFENHQSNFRAISEQFQSYFRAISEQFLENHQSSFRVISEQNLSNWLLIIELVNGIETSLFDSLLLIDVQLFRLVNQRREGPNTKYIYFHMESLSSGAQTKHKLETAAVNGHDYYFFSISCFYVF